MITPLELKPSSKANQVKVVRMPSGCNRTITYRLTDDEGQLWPITSSGKAVVLTAKDDFNSAGPRFQVVGTFTDAPNSTVSFDLTESSTNTPGIFRGEVSYGSIDPQDATHFILEASWPVYLGFEPSLLQSLTGGGPITIPEIRLMLDDLDIVDGMSLLDDVEFSDVQILSAIKRCVDQFNETPPHIGYFSASNFPYRYHWLLGTCGELLVMRANSYRRNRLAYSAGGVSIDDQNKSQEYEAVGQQKRAEYKEWVLNEKYRLNMGMGFSNGL